MPAERRDTFYRRTQLFRVDSKYGKDIKIRLPDGSIHSLPATGADGRTHRRLRVARSLLDQENRLLFSAAGHSDSTPRRERGSAWLVPTHGISIVSDIDDTIKDSGVLDRKTLLRNTFLNDFKPVAGMAGWYSRLRAHDQNVAFHYLSSSPIQLYPPLQDFLEKWEFPGGTIHLRESTSWRTVIATRNASQAHKRRVLMKLLTDFPERHFILIGDSGEADPEIYAEFARSHPKQITAIFIRDITGENAQSQRYRQTFSGISNEIWHVFREAPSF
ncbi:MAG: DUF2183 domain-containing protein [Xanthomonadaceae bacterium]|nr:DUF2183 domain-containing protein [Xanthomonadaceae bacterium]